MSAFPSPVWFLLSFAQAIIYLIYVGVSLVIFPILAAIAKLVRYFKRTYSNAAPRLLPLCRQDLAEQTPSSPHHLHQHIKHAKYADYPVLDYHDPEADRRVKRRNLA